MLCLFSFCCLDCKALIKKAFLLSHCYLLKRGKYKIAASNLWQEHSYSEFIVQQLRHGQSFVGITLFLKIKGSRGPTAQSFIFCVTDSCRETMCLLAACWLWYHTALLKNVTFKCHYFSHSSRRLTAVSESVHSELTHRKHRRLTLRVIVDDSASQPDTSENEAGCAVLAGHLSTGDVARVVEPVTY